VLRGRVQPAIENLALLAPVGNHFDFAHHDIGAVGSTDMRAASVSLTCRCVGSIENCADPTRRFHLDALFRRVLNQRKPIALSSSATSPRPTRIVVDRLPNQTRSPA